MSQDVADSLQGPLGRVSIKSAVEDTIKDYLRLLEDQPIDDLYAQVLAQVEPSLLRQVMMHVGDNQSKAARLLGLSRGTLRTKLGKYGLL
ncbi:DNA-binding transcriptional regulator Fis [Pseudomonadales bacterium]|jgi:Fis family transcriptional regulator|nr:Fis family transcriptional regulator [Gammaproteobacteria bacterium]MDA7590668.1 DNA-binding transcriptional regulator Fis [Pseudomonadales bacterium]MDC3304547.1 Fis family transcriptional regulator [bacterium]MBT6791704.1 Fis family transcriptional regulator [Gammaproteobacteria bacterium]MBT7387507.1 Fis family transcriptional regulator [Gammaproteobacteria bacterium]